MDIRDIRDMKDMKDRVGRGAGACACADLWRRLCAGVCLVCGVRWGLPGSKNL